MTPTLPTEIPWITDATPSNSSKVVVLMDLGPRYAKYDHEMRRWANPDGTPVDGEVYGWRDEASHELESPRWYEFNFCHKH